MGIFRFQAMQVIPYILAFLLGLSISSGMIILVGRYKYKLALKYINLYKITDPQEKQEELFKFGFTIRCECKPTLRDYFDATAFNNKIVILHWLRLIPVRGEKIGPIKVKTIHEKKDSFNNVFKSIHNRNKKHKDIREPFTNA